MSRIDERLERVAPEARPVLPASSDLPYETTRTEMRRLVKEKFECKDVGREAKNKIVYDNANGLWVVIRIPSYIRKPP